MLKWIAGWFAAKPKMAKWTSRPLVIVDGKHKMKPNTVVTIGPGAEVFRFEQESAGVSGYSRSSTK